VAVLAIIKIFFLQKPEANTGANSARGSSVPTTAIVVQPQAMEEIIYATGSILSNEEVTLHPEISGRIVKINFNEGALVSKGNLLVKINDADLQAQLQKSDLEFKLADERLRRNQRLLEMKGISQQEYDVLQNQVQAIRSDRDIILAQIAKTEIRAPFNGVSGV
jgi:membrane fusion protein (multidrug efflux system)